ncbi:hypothetical protein [Halorussus halophilus]|uniref:hypothetical protein n=1 Tax=Halorussus halophilus TaxID=2650975 RepID=UPI00130160C9|nr:hypothetical protein [Halorussus halophilus]
MSGRTGGRTDGQTSGRVGGRVGLALRMGIREYVRTPVLLALLVVLPVYFVGVVGYATPSATIPVEVGGESVRIAMNDLYATLAAPLAAALVGGIAGLFVMRSTREADARLVLAGYRPTEVVGARIGLLGVVCAVLSVVVLSVLAVSSVPNHVGWFAVATGLAALTYALVGALVGTVLGRLAGVYAMLFGPTIDVFLFQNPTTTDSAAGATFLPGHFATMAAMDAALGSGFDATPLLWGLAYLAVVAVVAVGAFYRAIVE